MGPERDNLSTPVVVLKNRAEIGSLLCQTVGTPLTHPDAMAIALATNEQAAAALRRRVGPGSSSAAAMGVMNAGRGDRSS